MINCQEGNRFFFLFFFFLSASIFPLIVVSSARDEDRGKRKLNPAPCVSAACAGCCWTVLSYVCVLSLRFLDLLLDGAVLCVCVLIKVFGPALGRCCPVCVCSH